MAGIGATRTKEPQAGAASAPGKLLTWTVTRERLDDLKLHDSALIIQNDTLFDHRIKGIRIS